MAPPPLDHKLSLAINHGMMPAQAAADLVLRHARMKARGIVIDPIEMAVREGWLSEAEASRLELGADPGLDPFPTESAQGPAGSMGEFDLIGRIDGHPVRRAGAGAVYLARKAGQIQALKVFPASFGARDDDLRSADLLPAFLEASRRLATLDGSKAPLIAIYSAGCSSGRPFLALQHVAGRDLFTELGRIPSGLPIPMILKIARAGLTVIKLLSGLGLGHGTLGQSSFILDRQDACHVLPPCPMGSALQTFQLATGAVPTAIERLHGRRSPDYQAPETVQTSQPPNQRSDLFSLGLVLYRACTGALPFPGVGPSPETTGSTAAKAQTVYHACAIASLRQRVQREVPSVCAARSVPAALDFVIWKLTRRDPLQRYATATEALGDLSHTDAASSTTIQGALGSEDDTVRIRRPAGLSSQTDHIEPAEDRTDSADS